MACQHTSVHRDAGISVLVGPVRMILPLAGAALLYPILFRRYDLSVVGAWALLSTLTTVLAAGDLGFSQVLTRDGGRTDLRGLEESYSAYRGARHFFFLLFFVGLLFFLFFSPELLRIAEELQYLGYGLLAGVAGALVGSFVHLLARIDGAILSARLDNAWVQAVSAAGSIVGISISASGALIGMPLEGQGAAICGSGFVSLALSRLRLRRKHAVWKPWSHRISGKLIVPNVVSLVARSKHFYLMTLGFLIRGPLVRWVVAGALGLSAAAIFDLALRIAQALRDFVAAGFSALFPAFAHHFRRGTQAEIVEISRVALHVLVPSTTLLLSLLLATMHLWFPAWLGQTPDPLFDAVRWLALWGLITQLNVPFWYALLASGHERIASWSIWVHSGLLATLIPWAYLAPVTLRHVLIVWISAAVLTQLVIYWAAQKRLSLVARVGADSRLLTLLTISALTFFFAVVLSINKLDPVKTAMGAFVGIVSFVISWWWISGKHIMAFIRELRRGAVPDLQFTGQMPNNHVE